MTLDHYGQSDVWNYWLNLANTIFVGIFTAEAVVKLLGLGFRFYFNEPWNRFDFIVVTTSLLGMMFSFGKLASLPRVVRVARIGRLLRVNKGMHNLAKTLIFSLPSLFNVAVLLLLVLFIFAILGVRLFAGLRRGTFVTDHSNFDTFGAATLTLFRAITGESYNGIMHDCMVQPPYCIAGINCGDPNLAPSFFMLFFVLSNYVMLNLLIAIILDNFSDTVALSNATVTDDHLKHFGEVWQHYDPAASHYIKEEDLLALVSELEYPLGVRYTPGIASDEAQDLAAQKLVDALALPVEDGRLHFSTTLCALTHRAMPVPEDRLPPNSKGITEGGSQSGGLNLMTTAVLGGNNDTQQSSDSAVMGAAVAMRMLQARNAGAAGSPVTSVSSPMTPQARAAANLMLAKVRKG